MRHHTHIIIRILTVILLLTNVSGGGNLAYALSGSGTSADPYTISSEAEWKEFAGMINTENSAYLSSCFKLEKILRLLLIQYYMLLAIILIVHLKEPSTVKATR